MGFEELASELHRHAEAEGRKLKHAAEREAARILAAASEQADADVKAAKREAAAYAQQEASERMTSAKLEAKKILESARDEAVDASLSQVWREFKSSSLKKQAYPGILARLIEEGKRELGTDDMVAYVRDEDKQLVSGMKTAPLPQEYSGGAILESSDGLVRVNKTLEEVFSQAKPSLRKRIYDKLF